MIKGLHHVGLSVANLDRAIEFYTRAASFEVVWRFRVEDSSRARAMLGISAGGTRIALLRGPTGFLELFQFDDTGAPLPKSEVHHGGIRHICLQNVDGNALFDAFDAAGSSHHARPSGLGTGNLYAYIRDHDDNIIEVEGLPWAAGLVSPPWLAHVAVVTPDIARLTAFYQALVGKTVHARGSFGPERKFDIVAGQDNVVFDGAWLKTGNLQLEFWSYHHPLTTPQPRHGVNQLGWSHFAFEVDDIDAEWTRLSALGVSFMTEPVADGPLAFAYGTDPDGNIVELLEIREDHDRLSLDGLSGRAIPDELDRLYAARQAAPSAERLG
jgi:catechol 2,3-dioxygenase-like lactoylglutathione lyase family enzyme